MASETILIVVGVTLLLVIAAMLQQRKNPTSTQQPPAAATESRPVPPAPVVVLPPRDPEAAGRAVIQHLRQLESRSSPGLSAHVMPVFLKDTAIRLKALKEAVDQQDATAAHRLAHTLYGSAATVGAATMVTSCGEVIRQVRCGEFDRCDDLITSLSLDFEAIRRAAQENQIAEAP